MSAPEKAAQEHEQRYQQLVELAPDGIVIHDGERVLLANSAALALVGAMDRDQVIGRPVGRFLDPPYLRAVQERLVDPDDLVKQAASPVRDRLRRLDGSEVEVEVRAIAFLDQDRPFVHLVIRDISDRLAAEQRLRKVEERLHQMQRLEAVGALAGGVAHEINNMMTVVLGFAEFLLHDEALSGEQRSDARQITRAAQRAALMTSHLLSFSRRAFHAPEVIDLASSVRDSEPMVQRLLGESRHLVVITEGTPRVRIDPRQLDQVIVNLALNARDAMPPGGTVTLTAKEIVLAAGQASAGGAPIPVGRYGVLTMSDTGAGMDDVTQARIFEPFFTTKPMGEGTGLGLAATYGIVKQNDGFIAVASTPGTGTSFSLYLPLVAERVASERRQSPRPPPKGRTTDAATILLVEDDPGVRAVTARILQSAGFRTLEAANGTQALEVVAEQGPPDLVLADLVMPLMGGAELGRHLLARWPRLPVLLMSGYSMEELRHQGALGSETVAITKPFTSGELVSSVTEALSRRRIKAL